MKLNCSKRTITPKTVMKTCNYKDFMTFSYKKEEFKYT